MLQPISTFVSLYYTAFLPTDAVLHPLSSLFMESCQTTYLNSLPYAGFLPRSGAISRSNDGYPSPVLVNQSIKELTAKVNII